MFLKNKDFCDERSLKKGLEILLGLCIATLLWNLNINSLLIIILFLFTLIDLIFLKKEVKNFSFRLTIWVIIPFIVFLIGVIWSINIKDASKELTSTISFLIFPFIFSHIHKYYKPDYLIVFKLFIFSCILKFAIFFISFLDFDPEAVFSKLYWKTVLLRLNTLLNERAIHPTYYSLFLGVCIYLSIYLIYKSEKKIQRFFWRIIVMVVFIILLAVMAKMPVLALLMSLFIISIISIFKEFNKKRIVYYLLGSIISIFSLTYFINKIPNTFVQDFDNYQNLLLGKDISDIYDYTQLGGASELDSWKKTNRIFLWKTGLQVWKQNYLFGTGTGDYKIELKKQYLKNNYNYLAKANMNTHNQYLSYLVQYGLFGFITIGSCFIILFFKAYQSGSITFIGILTLFFLTCLTENVLDRQWGIVSFSFFVSLFLVKER